MNAYFAAVAATRKAERMKQTQILLMAAFIATATFGQQSATSGPAADIAVTS